MYFGKIHHPLNFIFATGYDREEGTLSVGEDRVGVSVEDLGDEVFRISLSHDRWNGHASQAELEERLGEGTSTSVPCFDERGAFELRGPDGKVLLRSAPGAAFGLSGQAWLLQFDYAPDMRFYGMGEKSLGFERSHQQTKFWNTDLWADFHHHQILHERCDPLYISIPYLIVAQQDRYVGVLLNNPYAVFMSTHPHMRIADQSDADEQPESGFYVGAPEGKPEIYFVEGPSLAEVTRRLQRLCGPTPRPPFWTLGHHQCRWGYRSVADLEGLAEACERYEIPCEALWLDIDYMRGFRVFTFSEEHFDDPHAQLARLRERGFRVVPILDPGVKVDPAFDVYRDGLRERIFCLNPAGTPYVGFVWPGATVFPDYSLERARTWWSGYVERFARDVIDGVWIDMNDPSVGASELGEMLFDEGRAAHETYHNQYALGMAKATREGLLRANPDRRPFVLSRSACTSMARHAAVWNGDNYSNEHHLRGAIALSLNLSLSGLPFNGPDVPGFGGDATPELAALWYQAGCLFPFFRNHSATGTASQEPWAFDEETLRVIRHFIRLRYRLLPYIYHLFIEQERCGDPVMRPMIYHHASTPELPLDTTGDQYLLGRDILHAPFLGLEEPARTVALPAGCWYDLDAGEWLGGNRVIEVPRRSAYHTPLYIRQGAFIPMSPPLAGRSLPSLAEIEVHAFPAPGCAMICEGGYEWDDGETFAYREGAFSRLELRGEPSEGHMIVRVERTGDGEGTCRVRFLLHGGKAPALFVRRPGAAEPERYACAIEEQDPAFSRGIAEGGDWLTC